MSARSPRTTRHWLGLTSIALAGAAASLLTGCTSSNQSSARLLQPNDTDWLRPSTYASATTASTPHDTSGAARSQHCFEMPCAVRTVSDHHTLRHRGM